MPIGACLARGKAANIFSPGSYGSTFGGNPLACRVACSVLDIIKEGDFVQRAGSLGLTMMNSLRSTFSDTHKVSHIRGLGLMLGIELSTPAGDLMLRALKQEQVFINVTRDNVIRLLPCFISSVQTLDLVVEKLAKLLRMDEPNVKVAEKSEAITVRSGSSNDCIKPSRKNGHALDCASS